MTWLLSPRFCQNKSRSFRLVSGRFVGIVLPTHIIKMKPVYQNTIITSQKERSMASACSSRGLDISIAMSQSHVIHTTSCIHYLGPKWTPNKGIFSKCNPSESWLIGGFPAKLWGTRDLPATASFAGGQICKEVHTSRINSQGHSWQTLRKMQETPGPPKTGMFFQPAAPPSTSNSKAIHRTFKANTWNRCRDCTGSLRCLLVKR